MRFKVGDKVEVLLESGNSEGIIENVLYLLKKDNQCLYAVKLKLKKSEDLFGARLYPVSGYNLKLLHPVE